MIALQLEGGGAVAPGETVRGTVQWASERAPGRLELRLVWYTEGRGDRDAGLARSVRLEAPAASGTSEFTLEAPSGPWSWSGRLVSIRWAVEAVAERAGEVARAELVLGPERRARTLAAATG